jgi:hypothetical protein
MIDDLQASNDVPAGTFRLDINRESGVALQAKRIEIDRVRRRRKPQALSWERDLADLARIVMAARTHKEVPADRVELTVNWREPEQVTDAVSQVHLEEHLLGTSQVTVPDLLMERDPDLDQAAAEKLHAKNLEYNQRVGAAAAEKALTVEAGAGKSDPEAKAQAIAALAAAGGAAAEEQAEGETKLPGAGGAAPAAGGGK